MIPGFPTIGAPALRLLTLTFASMFLLAADVAPNAVEPIGFPTSAPQLTVPTAPQMSAAMLAIAESDLVTAPPADRPARLTTLVASLDARTADDRELTCLATAVYFEARGEPLEGQLAVAQAIRNRAASGRYPATVCGVINQPRQFSYDRTRAPRPGSDWTTAQAIAHVATAEMWHQVAPRAMSFHATHVAPAWSGKTRVAQIGRHVFYR